jgi:hypothetical protein
MEVGRWKMEDGRWKLGDWSLKLFKEVGFFGSRSFTM